MIIGKLEEKSVGKCGHTSEQETLVKTDSRYVFYNEESEVQTALKPLQLTEPEADWQ